MLRRKWSSNKVSEVSDWRQKGVIWQERFVKEVGFEPGVKE